MAAFVNNGELNKEDDYYAWLGLDKTASLAEINTAFRQMSRLYHPDKNTTSAHKKQAEESFTKIKRAHEVLSDPQLKTLYDTAGVRGLQIGGMQLAQSTKSLEEILQEWESVQQKEEECKQQEQTHIQGSFSLGLDVSPLFDTYSLNKRGRCHMSVAGSGECPLTTIDTVTLSGQVSVDSRTCCCGQLTAGYRRVLSHNVWAEGKLKVGSPDPVVHLPGFNDLRNMAYGVWYGSPVFRPEALIMPLWSAKLVQQLNKQMQGRLVYTTSPLSSSMRTSLSWDTGTHQLKAALQLGVPITFVKLSYNQMLPQYDLCLHAKLKIQNVSMQADYGCTKQISQFSSVSATMSISTLSGVELHLGLRRSKKNFNFPLYLCDVPMWEPIVFGTVLPLVGYAVVKVLLVNPFLKKQREKDLQCKKDTNSQWTEQKKKEAYAARELMKETVDQSIETEEQKGGLVIKKAVYGKLEGGQSMEESECINVTRPLQALVNNSKLVIVQDRLLSELPGFYDPCVGEEKQLAISYQFRQQLHTCKINEKEKLVIPHKSHVCENV